MALQSVYGIGAYRAEQVCGVLGLNPMSRVGELPHTIPVLSDYVAAIYPNKSNAQRVEAERIQRLVRLQSYRGQRHQYCLPLNGQKVLNGNTQRRIGIERARVFGFPLVRSKIAQPKHGRR
jgi:small subunit ribosomal protein S13